MKICTGMSLSLGWVWEWRSLDVSVATPCADAWDRGVLCTAHRKSWRRTAHERLVGNVDVIRQAAVLDTQPPQRRLWEQRACLLNRAVSAASRPHGHDCSRTAARHNAWTPESYASLQA